MTDRDLKPENAELDSLKADVRRLKATLVEIGWETATVQRVPSLACEALRTLQANLDRRKGEAADARAEIWALKNALTEALDGWERGERDAIIDNNSPAGAEIDLKNSAELARIAEIRAKLLEGE